MNTCVDVSHTDTTEADREDVTAESNQYKSKRYALIKQNPEALAKLKEYHKQKYEEKQYKTIGKTRGSDK